MGGLKWMEMEGTFQVCTHLDNTQTQKKTNKSDIAPRPTNLNVACRSNTVCHKQMKIILLAILLLLHGTRSDLLLQHADATVLHEFAALHGLPEPDHLHGSYYAVPTTSPAAELAHKAAMHGVLIEDADPLPFSYGAKLAFRPTPSSTPYTSRVLSPNAGWELPLTPGSGIHLNLTGLSERGIDGRGVRVTILDDGVDASHVVFGGGKPTECSYSLCGAKDTGKPQTSYDTHGTACAALTLARSGCSGHGVAPASDLCSVRVLCTTAPTTIQLARGYAANNDDARGSIISVSFGPTDNGITYYNLHPLLWDVLSSNMRNALIHVHASGNGYQALDTCAADGTISNPFVISVGAVDSGGNIAYYSEGCPSLTGVAPSSGSQDLISALSGRSHTECTKFGGTSAAAPQVAGLVALLKQVRPSITMRDARDALIRTADRTKLHAATFTCNAAGFCHSIRAGFGLFDGGAAVAYVSSPTYKPLPPQIQCAAEVFVNDALSGANVSIDGCAIRFVEYMYFEASLDGSISALRNVSWSTPAGTNSVFFRASHRYTATSLIQSGGIFAYGEQPNGAWRMAWNTLSKNVVTRVKLTLFGFQ